MLNVYTPMSWTHGYSYCLNATIEVNKNSSPPRVSWVGSLIFIPPLCAIVYSFHIMRLLFSFISRGALGRKIFFCLSPYKIFSHAIV